VRDLQEEAEMTRLRTIGIGRSTVLAAALLSVGSIAPAAADTQAAVDGATAAGLCTTSYPGVTGRISFPRASGT
jgi:hypothetical protein